MNLRALLRTPPPAHAFAAGEDQLAYGRLTRKRDALMRVERVAIDPGWFRLGPVGLLHVERQVLGAAVTAIVRRLEKPPQLGSLVAPNAWVRSVVVDAGTIPRDRQEADEVVRWRLKKILPCRPEEVRLDFVRPGADGRVLVVLALDKPLAAAEETFAAAGVEIGRIEPSALALTALLPASVAPVLLAAVEDRALALVVLVGGKPVLVRHKPLPADAARAETFIARELSRTLAHARDQEKLTGPVSVWLASDGAERDESVARWAAGENGVMVNRLVAGAGRVPPTADVPDVRLLSLLGTAWGGEE